MDKKIELLEQTLEKVLIILNDIEYVESNLYSTDSNRSKIYSKIKDIQDNANSIEKICYEIKSEWKSTLFNVQQHSDWGSLTVQDHYKAW